MRRNLRLRLATGCLCIILLAPRLVLLGASDQTAILVSEKDLESAVIENIISSIDDALNDAVILSFSDDEVVLPPLPSEVDSLIILGREALKRSRKATFSVPAIGGGFVGPRPPDLAIPTLSLELDPHTLFDELTKTAAWVERVWSVVTESTHPALIERTKEAAKSRNVELRLLQSNGERQSARAWHSILQNANTETDAIWIMDDNHLDASGAYRFLIERSWEQDLLLITSLPSYARRGAALGFIPDLKAYGHALVGRITAPNSVSDQKNGWLDIRHVARVFNTRSLKHIGVELPADLDQLSREDILVP